MEKGLGKTGPRWEEMWTGSDEWVSDANHQLGAQLIISDTLKVTINL